MRWQQKSYVVFTFLRLCRMLLLLLLLLLLATVKAYWKPVSSYARQ